MSYDNWKCQSPEDDADERERAFRVPRDWGDLVDEAYQRHKDGDDDNE